MMPNQPKRFCKYVNCNVRVPAGTSYCTKHRSILARSMRESFYQKQTDPLYNTILWRKVRASFLRQHPLCVHCKQAGYIVPATEVDHIQPHRGNESLFWDESNFQSLCKSCHSTKTRKEMGREIQ